MNLTLLEKIANHSPHNKYLHSCLIYSGSRLLSYGYNDKDRHAEIMAINRLSALYRTGNSRYPTNLHLISYRHKRATGLIGNSLPCNECMKAIIKARIKKVTFFNGNVPCQLILNQISNHSFVK